MVQPVYVSAGQWIQCELQQLLQLSLCLRLGSRFVCNSPLSIGHALAAYILGWTNHIKKAQSSRNTLALSSCHVGVSSATHQPLLTCFHW